LKNGAAGVIFDVVLPSAVYSYRLPSFAKILLQQHETARTGLAVVPAWPPSTELRRHGVRGLRCGEESYKRMWASQRRWPPSLIGFAVVAIAMAALWPLIVTLWCILDFGCAAPTAKTKNGTYAGFHLASYNQDLFLGIPYAQPPLGDLRLTVPKSLNSSFNGTRSATAYYPECVGYGGDDIGYEVSEDCLALNVIRPTNYSGQQLPVAVWIHGGGLQMGGTADRRYNLSFIVENSVQIGKPIIGVSIAYRLGPWGFLYSQQVQGSGNSNLGLRDQRLALHWIQENIAAFGGDPAKVTIWGESAGGYSVGAHLVAYGGRDDKLFRGAIMESGNPVNYVPYRDAGFYQPSYDLIAKQTGCDNQTDTLGCLRTVPYAKLNAVFNQTAFQVTPFEPVIDGDFIQKFGSIQLADGDFVKVPIIDGANTDEGTAFGPLGIENATQFAAYIGGGANPATQAALPAFFVQKILAAYPDDPSIGIPAELGAERLNATYGEYSRSSLTLRNPLSLSSLLLQTLPLQYTH
jgi:carboxylesterase type B